MKFFFGYLDIIVIIICMESFVMGVANPKITSIASYTNLKWFTFIAFAAYAVVRSGLKYLGAAGPIPIALMVFLVIATISTLTQYTDLEEAAKRVVSFWLLYLISFVTVIPLDPGHRLRAWTLAAVAVSGLVVAASLVLIPSEAAFDQGRLCGITNNANALGTFSAMLFAAGFGFVCSQGGPFRRARWLTQAAAGLTLMLSHSRTATIAAAAGVIIVLAVTRRWLAAALFAATATGYLTSPIVLEVLLPNDVTILKNAESAAHRDTLDLSTRQDVWDLQVQTWLESPLVGHGLEIHQEEGAGRIGGEGSYTDLLAAVGILGATPAFLGIGLGIVTLYRWVMSEICSGIGAESGLSLAALGMAAVIVVNSVGEGYLAAVGCMQSIYCWVILGAAGALHRRCPASPPLSILGRAQK